MQQYGKVIAQLRKERGMTQAELGAKLNVTYQAVSKWENDQSQPDFATMTQIATIFNVPLSIFMGEGQPPAPDVQAAPAQQPQTEDPVIGYCTSCGNAVREKDMAQQRPLLCKTCAEEARAKAQAAQQKAELERRQKAEAARRAAEAKRRQNLHDRNRGLVWGAIITGLCMLCLLIGTLAAQQSAGIVVGGVLVVGVFVYAFSSQLFWGGFIVDTVLFGGKIVGMPGVIFTFDLDGFIFLIMMKILFALLKMLIFLLTLLLSCVFALIVSPFTFVPALIRVGREGKGA